MAFASKYRNEDRVTLCFFGDGAINQGAFHEALNLAALFKLPVVFICENKIFASVRKESHPTFLEVRTYRYRGHSMSDPASYRTKEQLEKYRLDDPITRLRAQLTSEGKLTNEKFDELDKEAKRIALDSVKFAEQSPEPPLEKLHDYTYAP